MTSSFQLLKRRFGDERPGMHLLAVEEAAVPVTVVQADVLAQERKPLPIIEEFLVRLVAAGVHTGPDVAEMLGLQRDQVLEAAAIQVSENNLRRSGGALALTSQGAEVVRNLAATQPVVKTLPIVFDRLVWRLADYNRSSLMTKKDAQEQGRQLLPARQKARIGLGDVTAEGFNALLSARDGRERRVEILRVRKVSPNTHRYLPAQLLVYGDPARREVALALCIDGELQANHGLALDAINAVDRLGLSVGLPEPRPVLDADLESQRVGLADVQQLAAAEPEQVPVTSTARGVARFAVRSVGVFEHPDLLTEALDASVRRLLIISPWVRSAVVTTDFVSKLERRLRAGVEVTIAHGYGDDDSGSDETALKRLANLASRFRDRFMLTRLKNTHAKILIFDNQWVTTSFNWLSFRGDPERTYRMEEGTLVSIVEKVDEAYDRYRQLVAEQQV
ncbi:hypothetical protein FHE66_10170 [Georgenia sp. 311]|uniref:hypothetical protein n=1 Tax=Georgenia sp. 311 TaxID=2585134 RepID=UPI0011123ED8|nr:hypothetical protein [Georgenia sp. 311]TNC17495.1 hypothetical protein FHE66_10170 [Georgenia sp. 311]